MSARLGKKESIKEIIRCGRDPIYFLNNYAKIQHPVRGLIPFATYHYQDDIVSALNEHRWNLVLKARQLGITAILAGYIAWLTLFHKDKLVVVVATKQKTAKNMVRKVKIIFKHLPKWMLSIGKPEVNNVNSVELSNGSRVEAQTTSSDVGRTDAVSLLVVDEVAHIKNFGEIWTGLKPTISTGGRIALFSTPCGAGTWFHENWLQAREGINNFNCRFGTYTNPADASEVYDDRLMWWVNPEHDETWFAAETAGDPPRDIAQEHLCSFVASGDTFIYGEDLQRLRRDIREPMEVFPTNRDVWIWEKPDKEGLYLIPVDVSRGDALDFSAFHVLRLDTLKVQQVAEYKGKIRPDQLGYLLMDISRHYNNAVIAPENNAGWAGQTILKIEEASYPFLYYSSKRMPKYKENVGMADPYYASMRTDYLAGYTVTSTNRIPMLAKMEQYIRLRDIELHSSRLVNELETFVVDDNNKPIAIRGCNDDLVMSLAGGLYVREEGFMYTFKNQELTEAMLAGISNSNTKTSEIKDFNFNAGAFDRSRIQEHVEAQNKIVMGNGDVIDLNWLITSG